MRGNRAENLVEVFFEKQGLECIARQERTPFAEIDLVFRSGTFRKNDAEWILCEVKSQNSSRHGEVAVSWSQRARLKRAWSSFMALHGPTEFHLAIVDEMDQITVIENFLVE